MKHAPWPTPPEATSIRPPPVQLDQLPDQGHPNAHPAVLPGGACVRLLEHLKDVRQEPRIDALPRIPDDQLDVPPFAYDAKRHIPSLGVFPYGSF